MSVTIEAAVLARAMKHAAAVVESRNTIPILSNVRLMADGDRLELIATDLDVEFRQSLPLAEGGELATTVDAKGLSALAQAAPQGSQILLEIEERRLTVKSGRSRWKMPVLPVDDFPVLPFDEQETVSAAIDGAALATVLKRVIWSVSDEPTRSYLHGPMLHADDGKLVLAASNGHTLMRAPIGVDAPENTPDTILGPKFCRLLETLAEDQKEVGIEWSRQKARATLSDVVLTAKAIDGTFPDYRRAIPPELPKDEVLSVDPEPLRHAVRRVQVLSKQKSRCIKVERGADKLTLSMVSDDTSEGREEQPATCAEGFAAGFDAKYIDAMLAAIGGDTVTIHHADAAAPARFQRTVTDGAVGVVMPIRV